MTKHRRKSWASWFPIERGEDAGHWRKPLGPNIWSMGFGEIPDGATAVFVNDGPPMFVIGEGSTESHGWPTDIAANRKLWGMYP